MRSVSPKEGYVTACNAAFESFRKYGFVTVLVEGSVYTGKDQFVELLCLTRFMRLVPNFNQINRIGEMSYALIEEPSNRRQILNDIHDGDIFQRRRDHVSIASTSGAKWLYDFGAINDTVVHVGLTCNWATRRLNMLRLVGGFAASGSGSVKQTLWDSVYMASDGLSDRTKYLSWPDNKPLVLIDNSIGRRLSLRDVDQIMADSFNRR